MARPKKEIPPAKKRRITIRVTEAQYDVLAARARDLKMPLAEYIRRQTVQQDRIVQYHIAADFPQIQKLTREFSAIGNNLNQIAKHFNMGGLRSRSMQEEIHRCIEALLEMRQKVLELAGDDHGHPETHDE